jgi:hypothetical protein
MHQCVNMPIHQHITMSRNNASTSASTDQRVNKSTSHCINTWAYQHINASEWIFKRNVVKVDYFKNIKHWWAGDVVRSPWLQQNWGMSTKRCFASTKSLKKVDFGSISANLARHEHGGLSARVNDSAIRPNRSLTVGWKHWYRIYTKAANYLA